MSQRFIILHWILTLAIGPLVAMLIEGRNDTGWNAWLYIFVFLFSVTTSLPAFIISYLIFSAMVRRNTNPGLARLVLIGWALIAITATSFLFLGSLAGYFTLAYSLATIIVGFTLKIRSAGDAFGRI